MQAQSSNTIQTSSYSETGGGQKKLNEETEINRFTSNKPTIRVNIPILYSYMHVQLISANDDTPMEEERFARACLNAVSPIFGRAQVPRSKGKRTHEEYHDYDIFTILKYNKETKQAILQIQNSKIKQVWGSFTMCSSFGESQCKFEVMKVSPFLSYLCNGSRQWEQSL